jgi:PD-(D/E)XK nuclease superfamily protein
MSMTFIPSYTFYNDFDNCPHKAWRKYIKKDLPYEEKSEAQHKGTRMHVAMENAIGKDMPLPEEWKSAQALVDLFRNMPDTYPLRVEYKLAMTMDGPCAYDDKAAWFRGKLDVAVMTPTSGAWIIDWKTGKVREDRFELECQALLLKTNHPSLDPIVGEYYWFTEGRPGQRYTLHPDDTFVTLRNKWVQMKQFEEKKDWPKRPNPLCGWCPVKDCDYNTVGK